MAQATTTGARTGKGQIIALANGGTFKGNSVAVTTADGATITGRVTSRAFQAKFGAYEGRQVVFVQPDNPAPRTATGTRNTTRTGARTRDRFAMGGARCGGIFYGSAGEHEQSCNNPACPGD